MWLGAIVIVALVAITKCSEAEINVEAAFQGRCGHGSPCEQLCYELHDGMYECDCTEGYELNKDGYSCQEINSTGSNEQKYIIPDINLALPTPKVLASSENNSTSGLKKPPQQQQQQQLQELRDKLSVSKLAKAVNSDNWKKSDNSNLKSGVPDEGEAADEDDGDDDDDVDDYDDEEDDNYDESNKILLTTPPTTIATISLEKYQLIRKYHRINSSKEPKDARKTPTETETPTTPTEVQQKSLDDFYSKEDLSVYDDVNNNKLNLRSSDASEGAEQQKPLVTTTFEESSTEATTFAVEDSTENSTSKGSPCILDCGFEGTCESNGGVQRCLCPYGKSGSKCENDVKINIPRFREKSWVAFPALRGAYKHVQLHIEFRPESFDGILLLTGERDDLTGDFMAVVIHQGFVEFWFDCGSGTGFVRSEETVQLNQWNTLLIYRHRWDSWLLLNQGNRVQGRSKGLFSRITFREPVFLGGTGNITGLAKKLPVSVGLTGCIRKFVANEHEYNFQSIPYGDVTQGFDIQECTTDRCSRFPCHHGGKCLPSDEGAVAVCLCPLGFGGDLCEMRLDLQVPSFNGSSYLRYAPLADSAIIWLDIKVIVKPQQEDGLLLYSGHHEYGDFISLCLNMGFAEFTYDLGSGPSTVRSEFPLSMNQWHTIKVSRTARLAVLKIDQLPEVMTISPNGFWHLSLPHSLFLGGVHNIQTLPLSLREKGSFVGCIQKFELNEHPLSIISEALGGSNVDNCPHACVARPCGAFARCIPNLENYECECNPSNEQCNKAEEVSAEELNEEIALAHASSTVSPTTFEAYSYDSEGQDEDYYLEYYEDEATSRPDDDQKIVIRMDRPTSTTTTTTTTAPSTKVNPYKELMEDIESHYILRGRYMSEQREWRNLEGKKRKVPSFDDGDPEDNDVVDEAELERHKAKLELAENSVLVEEMEKIMKDGEVTRPPARILHQGACFNGDDSYFHYSDAETMRRVISYQIDLNLRFKTHSKNGVILWTGRHSARDDDDFLSLGIENGFLHLRYNLGSGEVNIEYNSTIVSDGLWHRVRAVRNLQEGTLKVDGGKPIIQRSPGKLRQLNTDAGLYVGGMPNPSYHTRNRYRNGVRGCISEVVLAGELTLDFDETVLGTAHKVDSSVL